MLQKALFSCDHFDQTGTLIKSLDMTSKERLKECGSF